MNAQIAILIDRIKSLEGELDIELGKRAAGLRIGWRMAGSASNRNCCVGIAN
jgi:hypothetical protein